MKTVLVGLDAFDPNICESLYEQGVLPHLGKLMAQNKYRRFGVANPPQSEVSWASIATGLEPAQHGLVDFVHRNPETYNLHLSLLPTRIDWRGTHFQRPSNATTLFEMAAADGYPATALFWSGQFPAQLDSLVNSVPGLGTPDLLGRWGVGSFFSTEQESSGKIPVNRLQKKGGSYHGTLYGVQRKNGEAATMPFKVALDGQSVTLTVDQQRVQFVIGGWSPIVSVTFKVGMFVKVQALTRMTVTSVGGAVRVYALPLQLHPLKPLWPYANPRSLARTFWDECGAWLTVGWTQDTAAFNEGRISADQFQALCNDIFQQREKMFMHQLASFEEGVLGCIFDTLDRVQHMFWRDRPDVIEAWYRKLDGLIGRVLARISADTRLVIVSDHGFTDFDQKVHLNRWLQITGYQLSNIAHSEDLQPINWQQTKVYAIGLNSLYLNLQEREGQGTVAPDQKEHLLNQLTNDLESWRDEHGQRVVEKVYRSGGEPDLVIGYARGFRGSAETALGGWAETPLEPNSDQWSGDHCVDPSIVPGVLLATEGLENFPTPTYHDIPALTIGKTPDGRPIKPITVTDDPLTERLKSLGYLN